MRKDKEVSGDVAQVVGDMPTYITFDVDALDPSFALGTGSPEVKKKCYPDLASFSENRACGWVAAVVVYCQNHTGYRGYKIDLEIKYHRQL